MVTRKIIRDDLSLMPKGKRVTKIGVIERIGEADWTSPAHMTRAHGKSFAGVRSQKLFN